jgi:O-antigen ligase
VALRRNWARLSQASLVAISAILALAVGATGGVSPKLGLLAALGLVFVALVLTNLKLGFIVMVMFAYLEVLTVAGGVSLAKVAGVLIVVAWIASASVGGGEQRNFFVERPGLSYLLLAFVGWCAISTAWAESRSLALESVMRYALNAFLIPIAYVALRDRKDAKNALAAIVIGASVAAVSAILSPPAPESAIAGRAAGTVGDPNELAAALIIGLAVAGAFAVNRHVSGYLRLLAAGAGALCLAGILISLSRGGLIGLAGALLVAVIVGGRWRGRVLALCMTLVGCAVGYFAFFASLPAKERVLNISGGGGSGRLDLWTVGLRMIEANPLNGIGTGQFANSSVHYLLRPGLIESGAYILETPKVAHNTYLNIVAELGIVGGLLFVSLLAFSATCTLVSIKRAREARDESMEILLRGLAVGFGGYLVTLMFLSENTEKLLWIMLGLGPVMLAITTAQRNHARELSPPPLHPAFELSPARAP